MPSLTLEDRDVIQQAFNRSLFIPVPNNEEIKRPVVILQGEKSSIYPLLEACFLVDVLVPPDRFWRNVRESYSPPLKTWRPRVNGVQLKVMQDCRLPETDQEWIQLVTSLLPIEQYLRPDRDAQTLTQEIKEFAHGIEVWWDKRKRGEGGPSNGLKRPFSSSHLDNSAKRQNTDMAAGGVFPFFNPNPQADLLAGGGYMQQLAAVANDFQFDQRAVLTEDGAPSMISLNIGGHRFLTTPATLSSVPGSYFAKLVKNAALTEQEIFIDRNGRVFEYVLDYLRCTRFGDTTLNMPSDERTLRLLSREAQFFKLPDLQEKATDMINRLNKSKNSTELDAVFVETGFVPPEEITFKQHEALRTLNDILMLQKSEKTTIQHDCSIQHLEGKINISYHVLLTNQGDVS